MKRNYEYLKLEFKKYEKNNQIQLRFLDDLRKDVFDSTMFLDLHHEPTNSERIFCIKNDIYAIPKCKLCGKETKYSTKTISYPAYCSAKCSNSDKNKIEKTKKTFIEKYGVDNPMKDSFIKNVSINNSRLKNFKNVDELRRRKSEIITLFNKGQIEKLSNSEIIWCNKRKNELKEEADKIIYNGENSEFINSIEDPIQKIYSIKNNISSIPKCIICEKPVEFSRKKKSYTKYCSHSCRMSDPLFQNSIKETCVEKFGVDNPMKNDEIKNKLSKINAHSAYDKTILNDELLDIVEPLFTREEYFGSKSRGENRVKKKYPYLCKNCGKEFIDWMDLSYKKTPRCPDCFPKYKSRSEAELLIFIKSLVDSEIIENDRVILDGYEIDIYIPEKGIGIEFNGLYWHSELKGKNKDYHLKKLDKCNSKGIRLITIFEDEWVYKKEIVKDKLIHILGKSKKEKIYARKCKVSVIDSKTKNVFLDKNHIQGKDKSLIKLGLYYNGEIVGVMTFAKPRISLGQKKSLDGEYELVRFATDNNYIVIGGFGKIFKYFKDNYDWKKIITYADRRWSNGEVYKKNNFELSHASSPSYWYLKLQGNEQRRYHRYSFRKDILKTKYPDVYDENLTEYEIMKRLKYDRVWDCGNLTFIYNR